MNPRENAFGFAFQPANLEHNMAEFGFQIFRVFKHFKIKKKKNIWKFVDFRRPMFQICRRLKQPLFFTRVVPNMTWRAEIVHKYLVIHGIIMKKYRPNTKKRLLHCDFFLAIFFFQKRLH